MTQAPGPELAPFVVVRTQADVVHPHLNVWLPEDFSRPTLSGHLQLLPTLTGTFEGLAEPTQDTETGPDGTDAQIYRLITADLRTPAKRRRPTS